MANAHRIARECGIKLHGRNTARPSTSPGTSEMLPAKRAWCRDAIKRVADAGIRENNPDHVYDVLGLLVSSETGRCMLFAEVIKGVSYWMRASRITTADVAFIKEAFGEIDMVSLRSAVVSHRIPHRSVQIALMISFHMVQAVDDLRR